MGYLDFAFESACMVDRRTVADGMGGMVDTWVDGAVFAAAFAQVSSTDALIAYQTGQKTMYKVITRQTVALKHNDRIRRLSDGQMMRITSNAQDMRTPDSSGLKMYQVTAEVIEP
jgi:hypothetical protein